MIGWVRPMNLAKIMQQGDTLYYGVRQFVYNLPVYVSKRDMITNAVDIFIAGYAAMLEQRNKTPMSTTTAAN